jgi:hypothetical protein
MSWRLLSEKDLDAAATNKNLPKRQIELLRLKLSDLEAEARFDGNPYPEPLCPFPWPLTGRGFFPAGDGIWRDPDLRSIAAPPAHPFPLSGTMFLGQDFGSISTYPPRNKPYELDNVPTWPFLVRRMKIAGIPGPQGFFTNALLGLRREGSTIGANSCIRDPRYESMCRDFLSYQIQIQDPILVVVFQTAPDLIYRPLLKAIQPVDAKHQIYSAFCQGRRRVWLTTEHPRSDSGVISRNPANYSARCKRLARAWEYASAMPEGGGPAGQSC